MRASIHQYIAELFDVYTLIKETRLRLETPLMHNSREVLQLVANVKEDQLISAGNDLIIKVWRVFPYAAEPLTLLRNIFCAYSPEFVCLLRDRICVAYNDPKTLTHSIVFFNRQSNERYDHRPEVDHTDRITAISSCEKMKLLASASMDGSLRIWDINCQLIRCIKLKEKPDALAYCSTKADLLVAIGNHVFKIYSKSYLPKTILFKMVGMEFEELKKEEPIPYNSDVRDTLTPTSFQRLKSAHKNEFHFEAEAAEIDEAEMEQYENEIFDLEQKQRNEGIFLLMQRDTELNKLYNGEIKPKEKHIKKRVAKEAFNNYMKLFYNPDHKVKFQEPDYFYLSENDIFPKPVIIEKHEQFIYKEPAAFFPPISTAKNKNPHDALLKDYEENRKKNMKKLQEQEQFDQSSDKEYNIESIYMEELNTKNLTEFNKKQQMNETYNSSNTSDSRIEKDVQHKPSKNEGSSTAIDESHNKSPTYLTEVDVPDRKKRPKQTSRTSDKPSPTISPILENRVEEETQQAEYYTASYYKYLDELEKKKKETVKDVAIRGKRKEMESDDRAPYFISGGFIPNSILIRILWPSKELDDLNQKSWKPKALSEEQMEQLKAQKVVRPVSAVSDKDEDTEEKDKRKKSGEKVKPGEAEATEEQPKVKPEATRASLKDKLSDIVKKVATPPPTPPPEPVPVPVEPTKPKLGIPNKDLFKEKSERLKEMKEQMQQTILEKEKTREANEVAAVERAKHREQEEEKARERERTLELEREASRLQAEQLAAIPKVPTFVKPFQETSWFQKYFGEVPIENLPRNEEAFYLELFKKANETVTNDALELAEIAYMLDVLINVLKEREIQNKKMNESLANCVINLIHNAKLDVRDSYHREFLFKCFQLLATLGHNIKNVVIEWMYWYLESIESVRRYIRGLFDAAGICEFSHYFYQEIDSWEVWKIEQSGQRRKQIKKMCSDWLQKWITLFQMHIKDTYEKMRKGPFEGTISKSSKGGILKSGPESRDSKRPVTVKFDLNNEKATVQNVTPIESINYFCEMMHEQEKLKPKNKDNGEEKNTVLVVPKLNTNTVLIRLGESNTDMCRPKQRDEYYLPPIRISSKYTYGDILPTSHINLPMKKVTPFPFRKAVDNITYEDEEAVFDAIEYLKQPYHLITLRTAQKYFIPEQTYTHYLD